MLSTFAGVRRSPTVFRKVHHAPPRLRKLDRLARPPLRILSVAYEGESFEPTESFETAEPETFDAGEPESFAADEPESFDEGFDPVQSSGKKRGVVKWFDSKKGFGFIQPDDGTPDVFVHQTNILCSGYRALRDGEQVEFALDDGEDGRTRAVQVTGPDGAQPLGSGMEDPYLDGRGGSSRYTSEPFTGMGRFSSGLQLVVHNLPWSVSSDRLLECFTEFGAIEAEVQYDELGRSRGYGIIKFNEKEDAERAIEEMHMSEMDGRNIMVRYDRYG